MNSTSRKLFTRSVNRRRVLKGAAAAGLGLGAASSVFSAPSVLGQEKTPVVFWTNHTDIGFEALTKITEDFNAQSDSYTAEIVQRPPADESDSSSLITAVRGGVGPDVYLLDRFIVAERAANGLLQDIKPVMEAAGDSTDLTETYADFAAAEATYNEGIYALPFDTDLRALFYNKPLLEAAGVDLAMFDSANGPMTFDAFKEAIVAVNQDDGTNYSQVGFIPYFGQGWHYTYGFAYGGEFFDYENCQVTPDNEQVLQGLQWVADYTAEHDPNMLYAFAQNAMRNGAAPTDSPFIQGRLGAVIDGNWTFQLYNTYMENPDDVGFTYTPVPNDGDPSITWAGGWSGVIPEGAKNVEGGYEFLKYLCGPDGSRTYVTMNNNLPVIRELLSDRELLGENLSWIVDNLFETTRSRPPLPVGAKYWDELGAGYEAIYLGQTDPATAMANAKQNTQADLDAGGYCPIVMPPEVEDVASPQATPAS